jgi:hypothetical protein
MRTEYKEQNIRKEPISRLAIIYFRINIDSEEAGINNPWEKYVKLWCFVQVNTQPVRNE